MEDRQEDVEVSSRSWNPRRREDVSQDYRRLLIDAGIAVEADQDVHHIIARENGGADHPDNYLFVANMSFNRGIKQYFDGLMCYFAGKEKAKKAVKISKQLNGYRGPEAMELYRQGEEVFRTVGHEYRRRPV